MPPECQTIWIDVLCYVISRWQKWSLVGNYKTCVKRVLSRTPKIVFQDQLSLNAGQKYAECSNGSILQYFRPSLSYHLSLRLFILSTFEWPFYTGFTANSFLCEQYGTNLRLRLGSCFRA